MSDEIKNLIKLLANNKRLDIIPDIADELKQNISKLDNSYDGVIYTNKPLDDSEVEKISNQFAKKFDIKLSLTQNICDYDGIKVDIDGLGVDINFSKERLKSQMIEHILKAV
jgi:F-type H+-transporting ATPase subunit delta